MRYSTAYKIIPQIDVARPDWQNQKISNIAEINDDVALADDSFENANLEDTSTTTSKKHSQKHTPGQHSYQKVFDEGSASNAPPNAPPKKQRIIFQKNLSEDARSMIKKPSDFYFELELGPDEKISEEDLKNYNFYRAPLGSLEKYKIDHTSHDEKFEAGAEAAWQFIIYWCVAEMDFNPRNGFRTAFQDVFDWTNFGTQMLIPLATATAIGVLRYKQHIKIAEKMAIENGHENGLSDIEKSEIKKECIKHSLKIAVILYVWEGVYFALGCALQILFATVLHKAVITLLALALIASVSQGIFEVCKQIYTEREMYGARVSTLKDLTTIFGRGFATVVVWQVIGAFLPIVPKIYDYIQPFGNLTLDTLKITLDCILKTIAGLFVCGLTYAALDNGPELAKKAKTKAKSVFAAVGNRSSQFFKTAPSTSNAHSNKKDGADREAMLPKPFKKANPRSPLLIGRAGCAF